MAENEQSPRPEGPAGPERSARPRRSDASRSAILAAARERFASDGYERATIRAIAKDAGIDPSMVMRYYGNKEGLFAAAVEFDLRMPDLTAVPQGGLGRVLVRHFLSVWEEAEVLQALLRVGVTNSAGAERIRRIFTEQLLPVARSVCPDPAQAPVRAALVAAQILGMALGRYVLCFPPAVAMSHDDVVYWLAPTVQRYLSEEDTRQAPGDGSANADSASADSAAPLAG
ncbi:TetR family transcriptional regulator [Streptomyces sp. TS71-3]|uniref:TetR/AcrR family transcriptional regulator n=1 Tax=Streptomyces sp. TS71-3 TaxID=2733862 RepID=UPI001B245519|nr:TetR family transcriptional regulator [Streptomyces sp. TS71-3]GHJ37577.1 TetR family transcriptional regulator [Streptomyces sp. TS71-3]